MSDSISVAELSHEDYGDRHQERRYYVLTPTYYDQCDVGVWHTEVRDCVEVRAPNKREAKTRALPELREQRYFRHWHDWDQNPFAVLTVEADAS